VALDLHNIRTNENHKLITLDIKDLYVNLPVQGIIQITKFWLNKDSCDNTITEQTLYILEIILKQNYFQYNGQYYQPDKGIAMGSPISSTLAEIYLKYLEEIYVKHWLENMEIILYKRYIDDILIIYDQTKTDETTIYNTINNIDKNLEFKITGEENNTVIYLDLSINRNSNHIELGIYRKPTHMDIFIHRSSNHPYDHKLAAFKYYINRMVTLPITEQVAKQEWEKIIAMAHNNGFPEQTVQKLRTKLRNKRDRPDKGIAMGSPISSTLAEIYLQYLEEIYVKHWLENSEIILYKRYVDDILIIYDKTKTDETTIYNIINNIDKT